MSEGRSFLAENSSGLVSHGAKSGVLGDYLAKCSDQLVFEQLGLTRLERQLIMLAALAASGGTEAILISHTRNTLAAGATPDEIISVAEHALANNRSPQSITVLKTIHKSLADAVDWPAWATSKGVEVEGKQVPHLDSGGDGPVVLLCHAATLDHRMWIEVACRLAPRFRVLAPDLLGHMPGIDVPPANLAQVARHVLRFLDAKGVDKVHVAGSSMGGAVAQYVAIQASERVRTLSLMATLAKGVPPLAERADAAESEGMSAQMVPTLTRWFEINDIALNSPAVRYARGRIEKTSLERWTAVWRSLAAHDPGSELACISCPVTCIGGKTDNSCPPPVIGALAAAIPGAITEFLDGPHLFALTDPNVTADILRRAFDRG